MSDAPHLNALSAYARITDDLPGIPGRHKVQLEDFRVREVPLYEPSGQGDHVYLWVQKRDVSAGFLKRQLRDVLGVDPQDIGMAGMKDRAGVTQQWISLPAHQLTQSPESLEGPLTDQIDVLKVSAHTNKLKMGHLKGNAFEVVVRELPAWDRATLQARVDAKIQRLATVGLPNYYDTQRFGRDGSTLELGVGWLRGEAAARKTLRRNKSLRRLALNAVQSAHFNQVLALRVRARSARTVLSGDVMGYPTSGSVFAVHAPEEIADAQARLDAQELVVKGPMEGSKMLAAHARALAVEQEAAAQLGFEDLMGLLRRELPGTRRALLVVPQDLSATLCAEAQSLTLKFFLPAGTYATLLCEEIYVSAL